MNDRWLRCTFCGSDQHYSGSCPWMRAVRLARV